MMARLPLAALMLTITAQTGASSCDFVMSAEGADCDATCGALGLSCHGHGDVVADCAAGAGVAGCDVAGMWILRQGAQCHGSWGTSNVCNNNYNAFNAFCCNCGNCVTETPPPPTPDDDDDATPAPTNYCMNCRFNNGHDDAGYNNGCPKGDSAHPYSECSAEDCSDGVCDVSSCDVPQSHLQCNCPPNANHVPNTPVGDLGCSCAWPHPGGSYRPVWTNVWGEVCATPQVCVGVALKIKGLQNGKGCKEWTEVSGLSRMECALSLPKTFSGHTANFAHFHGFPPSQTGQINSICQYCKGKGTPPVPKKGYKSMTAWTTYEYVTGGPQSCDTRLGVEYAAVRQTSGGQKGSTGMVVAAVGAALACCAAAVVAAFVVRRRRQSVSSEVTAIESSKALLEAAIESNKAHVDI